LALHAPPDSEDPGQPGSQLPRPDAIIARWAQQPIQLDDEEREHQDLLCGYQRHCNRSERFGRDRTRPSRFLVHVRIVRNRVPVVMRADTHSSPGGSAWLSCLETRAYVGARLPDDWMVRLRQPAQCRNSPHRHSGRRRCERWRHRDRSLECSRRRSRCNDWPRFGVRRSAHPLPVRACARLHGTASGAVRALLMPSHPGVWLSSWRDLGRGLSPFAGRTRPRVFIVSTS
jgi:hypothetical protein